jgi:iron complex transport system substrate-binding protein
VRQLVVTLAVFVVVVSTVPVGVSAQASEPVDCAFPVTQTDATGEEVTVGSEPDRVVALAPSAAQTMWEIGAEEKVVGMPVNAYTAYLNGSRDQQSIVGEDGDIVTERVLDREPDLVLAPGVVGNDTVEQLRSAGLTVYRFDDASSIDDVYRKTALTGRLVGRFPAAAQRSAQMQAEVEAVAEAVEGADRPRVLYLFGPSGFTAGPDTFIGELVATAGGDNVAAAANISTYAVINPEVILAQDPEWLVVPEGRPLPETAVLNETTAVREGQVVRPNVNYLNQPAPRNTIPLRQFARAFHPDAADDGDVDDGDLPPVRQCANPTPTGAAGTTGETQTTATTTPSADASGAGTAESEGDAGSGVSPTETAGGTGDGFGPVGAVVALFVTAVLASRR